MRELPQPYRSHRVRARKLRCDRPLATEDAGKPIDAEGELPDGTKFTGPEELKKVLMAKKDLFIRNLTTRMLGYALGRGLTREDTCAVDRSSDQLAANNYRAQTLIRAIVTSPAFIARINSVPPPPGSRGAISSANTKLDSGHPWRTAGEHMNKLKFPISRRTMLRGAGVSLALPWLEAMAPRSLSAAVKAESPRRMAVLYMPNGVNVNHWAPEGTGSDFKLSATLEPLRDLGDQILVLQNLWNPASKDGDGHYVKEAAILTSTRIEKTLGEDLNCHGISMDQVAAQKVGKRNADPFTGTRHFARSDRRGSGGRVYAGLWLPHLLGRANDAACARDQSAFCLRTPVPRRGPASRKRGEAGYAAARPGDGRRQAIFARNWGAKTAGGSMNTCRSCALSKSGPRGSTRPASIRGSRASR